jgi:hypothetical protein
MKVHRSLSAALALTMLAGCGASSSSRAPHADGGADAGAGESGGGPGSGGRAGTGGNGTGGRAGTGGNGTGGAKLGTGGAKDADGGDVPDGSLDASVTPDATADAAPDDPRCTAIDRDATFTANVRITADNECEVFVNGASIGTTNNWGVAVTLDVSLHLHPSQKNVIAVRATNTSSQAGPDRGIIGVVSAVLDGGVRELVVTDGTWRTSKVSPEAGAWTGVDYDDSDWAFATVVANHGQGPWGTPFGTTDAKWIWSDVIPNDTANKPNLETAYARKDFYFALDAGGVTDKPTCH